MSILKKVGIIAISIVVFFFAYTKLLHPLYVQLTDSTHLSGALIPVSPFESVRVYYENPFCLGGCNIEGWYGKLADGYEIKASAPHKLGTFNGAAWYHVAYEILPASAGHIPTYEGIFSLNGSGPLVFHSTTSCILPTDTISSMEKKSNSEFQIKFPHIIFSDNQMITKEITIILNTDKGTIVCAHQ